MRAKLWRADFNQREGIPAALGFRMPAEWEAHQATWISWPHKEASWPGKFHTVEPVMVKAVRALLDSETVHINVLDAAHERHVCELLGTLSHRFAPAFHRLPTNDAWCRDHGAIFVTRQQQQKTELAAVDCRFNAWGDKYPPYDLDNAIPSGMAEFLDVPRFEIDMVLEGGSIDVNGAGSLLTTESCLLNPNRNPDLGKADIERRLMGLFGVQQILWLGDGIAGDDTDGHVDDLTRFVAEDTVVTVLEEDPADENYHALQDNLSRLATARLPDGRPLQVIRLPMPPPVVYEDQRLPASYANFYIANRVVLLPIFGHARDQQAIQVLEKLFPARRVVGIDCTDLVWGLGAFHCLTQQVPAI